MNCPKCASPTKVIDSRINPDNVRRRRQCMNEACFHRYTTYEQVDDAKFKPTPASVLKLKLARKMIDEIILEADNT